MPVLSLLLTTLLPQLWLKNVTVSQGIAEKVSSCCRHLDKRCFHVEKTTQAAKYFRMETADGRKAFSCCQGPDTVSQLGAVGCLTPQPELWAAASQCECKAVSLGQCCARLDGAKLKHSPSEENITPSPLHQCNLRIFPSQPWLSAWLTSFALARCIARAWQMTGTKKDGDVFTPHSPSHSWDRRQALWVALGLDPVWLLPSSGRIS